MLDRLNSKMLAIVVLILLVTATFVLVTSSGNQRTLSANFSRAISIYKGSDVRLMGVKIGTVTSVVPQGATVRVGMEYDGSYKLPADAMAAIVTPTLVADRFVQITPAYSKGAVLSDGAVIPEKRTETPVEIDEIYRSLAELTNALGPNGANKNGALNSLVGATAKALKGRGALANRTLLNLSQAVQTFGDNSGPLFSNVRQLAKFSQTLAVNNTTVNAFMKQLAAVSGQLSGERGDLGQALAAIANAVGIVRNFVHNNKSLVESDLRELTTVVQSVAKEKTALGTSIQLGALGLGNLADAYDVPTGTIGSRVQVGPTAQDIGNILCDIVVNSGVTDAKSVVCPLLKKVTAPLNSNFGSVGAGIPQLKLGSSKPVTSLQGLLGALP